MLFFSEVAARKERDDGPAVMTRSLIELQDPFTASDLADLRGYVEQLPPRERAVVVMRFWQQARELEIAAALGVTPRTVRNLLRRAIARLAALYVGSAMSLEHASSHVSGHASSRRDGEGGDA